MRILDLKPETLDRVEAVIPKYPVKRSAILPVLHYLQADLGYISRDTMEWVAEKLELEPINVYEIVTFYPFFREQPTARRIVRVCRTLPCALSGAYKICQKLQTELGCTLEEPSEDGEVAVEFAECLAGCGTGPVVMVDDEFYENVDESKAEAIAAKIKGDKVANSTETSS